MQSTSLDTYKIRPIVGCVGGPADVVVVVPDKYFSSVVTKKAVSVNQTKQFLVLRNTDFEQNCVMESFDVFTVQKCSK